MNLINHVSNIVDKLYDYAEPEKKFWFDMREKEKLNKSDQFDWNEAYATGRIDQLDDIERKISDIAKGYGLIVKLEDDYKKQSMGKNEYSRDLINRILVDLERMEKRLTLENKHAYEQREKELCKGSPWDEGYWTGRIDQASDLEESLANIIKRYVSVDNIKQDESADDIEQDDETVDMVNHPAHYTGNIECIDAMTEAFGQEAVDTFCLLNTFKYIWRCKKKGKELEDLRKAQWYFKRLLEKEENTNDNE